MNGLVQIYNNQSKGMVNNSNSYYVPDWVFYSQVNNTNGYLMPNFNYYEYQAQQQAIYQQQLAYQQQMQEQAMYEAQLRQAVMEQEQQRLMQQQIYQQQPQIQYGYQYQQPVQQQLQQQPIKDDIIFSLSVDPTISQQIFQDNSCETPEVTVTIGEIFEPTQEELANRKREEKGAKYRAKQIKRWLSDKFNPQYDKLSFPVIKYLDEMKCTIEELIANHTMYGLDVVMW